MGVKMATAKKDGQWRRDGEREEATYPAKAHNNKKVCRGGSETRFVVLWTAVGWGESFFLEV